MHSASLRKIRPSFEESSNAPSTSNPIPISDSTRSDPRRRARREIDSESIRSTMVSSRRRRVPESVTRNACVPCKKARAKCDGNKPCKRCATRAEIADCTYEVHLKQAKEELVRHIKELRSRDYLTKQILLALSTHEKVPEILDRLERSETYESIVEWLGRSPMEHDVASSPRTSQRSTFEPPDHEMSGVNPTSAHWTTVTSNPAVLQHLFQLYFAWVHPVHTLFSEGHFVRDYKEHNTDHCSSILVNAICSMACHLHSAAEHDAVDFEQLGDHFSEAVRTNLETDDNSITTTQALVIMFLVDCARAKVLQAGAYLRIATTNLSKTAWLDTEGFSEVWKNTTRGIRNLNVEWAQATFQAPPITSSPPFEGSEDDDELDAGNWYFYRYTNDQCPAWPCLLGTTNREKSKLINIISDAATKMYTPQAGKLAADDVLRLYDRFLAWRKELPSSLGNIESHTSQALPHVLSLLILYSSAVVQLLRPLLDYDGFPSNLVEEIVWETAQEGLFLLNEHYRARYTCRYQPGLQMVALLHLTDVICRFFPTNVNGRSRDGAAAIRLALESLMQSSPGFRIAGIFQELLRRTANECSVPLPDNLSSLLSPPPPPKQKYGMLDFIDACMRPTYVQPAAEIHSRYVDSFAADWASKGGPYSNYLDRPPGMRLGGQPADERSAQRLMQIRNLLNSN